MFQGILNLNEPTVVLTLTLNSVGPKAQADTQGDMLRTKEKEGKGTGLVWWNFFYCKSNLSFPCFGKLSKKCFSKPLLGARLRGDRLLYVLALQTPGRNLGICKSSALFWPLSVVFCAVLRALSITFSLGLGWSSSSLSPNSPPFIRAWTPEGSSEKHY